MKLVDLLARYFSTNLKENDPDYKEILKQVNALIKKGANVNTTDEVGLTPLHIAVNYSMPNVTLALITAGADVNAKENLLGFTPLHYSIKSASEEIMCMLLCYGADVTCANRMGMTPLMLAIKARLFDMVRILLDYYDDFSHRDVDGFTALSLATQAQNPIAIDLVTAGADMSSINDLLANPLLYSLIYETATLFKLIWQKVNHKILADIEIPFLFIFLHDCCFPTEEWLECIYLILESEYATLLIDQTISYGHSSPNIEYALFTNILHALNSKSIPLNQRITIIQICLSLGAEVDFNDVVTAYNLYGCNEEFNIFIYTYNFCGNYKELSYALPTFMFILEQRYDIAYIYRLLEKQLIYCAKLPGINMNESNMLNALCFFALPDNYKLKLHKKMYEITRITQTNCYKITQKIEALPEVASLVELSRNQTRIFIKKIYNIQKPYQFYDKIKNLQLPQLIKDIITFKMPIYL